MVVALNVFSDGVLVPRKPPVLLGVVNQGQVISRTELNSSPYVGCRRKPLYFSGSDGELGSLFSIEAKYAADCGCYVCDQRVLMS